MNKELKGGRLVGFLLAIFLANIALMNDQAIIPVINNIYGAFPENVNMVNYIVTGSLIVFILTSLIAGKLMEKIGKKTLIVVSFGVFSVAAIFCVAIENIIYIAAMRSIIAATIGIINVSAIAMLVEAFQSEEKRSAFVGLFNASMAGIGAAIAIVAGILALTSWQNVFNIFYICIPVLILMIFFLPNTPPDGKHDQNGPIDSINLKKFVPFVISILVFVSVFMVFQYMVSVYVAEHNLGDAAFVGICASTMTIASGIVCASFGLIYPRLRETTYVISFALIGVSYLLLYLFPGTTVIVMCSAFMGMAFGNGLSYFYTEATVIVPPSQISKSIAIVTAVQATGMFISTYLVTFCMSMLGTESLTATFPIFVVIMIFGTVYATFAAVNSQKIRRLQESAEM